MQNSIRIDENSCHLSNRCGSHTVTGSDKQIRRSGEIRTGLSLLRIEVVACFIAVLAKRSSWKSIAAFAALPFASVTGFQKRRIQMRHELERKSLMSDFRPGDALPSKPARRNTMLAVAGTIALGLLLFAVAAVADDE